MTFKVDAGRCGKCGKCVKDCPTNTLVMKDGVPSVRDGKGDGCIRRGVLLVLAALAVGCSAAMTVDEAKAFMTESRTRFLSAKSYHVEYTTTAMGVPTESRCWIRRDTKKGVAVINESQTKPFGIPMPKMTQLATGGKVYVISALAPNKALHLKFADGQVQDDIFCNFFTEQGTVEPISDTKDKCVIKFSPSVAELAAMRKRVGATGGLVSGAVLPASFRYTFLKPSKDISEIVGYNEKGEKSLKIVVSKLELNATVEDSYFALPKDCEVVDLKSAAEAAKILAGGLVPKK